MPLDRIGHGALLSSASFRLWRRPTQKEVGPLKQTDRFVHTVAFRLAMAMCGDPPGVVGA